MALLFAEFAVLVEAETAIREGRLLTEEQKSMVALRGLTPEPCCGCGCGQSLDRHHDEPGHRMEVNGKTVEVNADCYYEEFGKGIDESPIVSPRFSRGC